MEWVEKLKKHFDTKKAKLKKGIESAKKARDTAPSAMESATDTTRSQNERLVTALEDELSVLEKMGTKLIDNSSYAKILLDNKTVELIIVPEGMGGETIDNILFISSSSPLAKSIDGKKNGQSFEFNGKSGKIIEST